MGEENNELKMIGLMGEEDKELVGVIAGELCRMLVGHAELVVAEESGTDSVILGMLL